MKIRQFVAATAIATAAVFATAGVAGAQTTPTTPTTPSGSVNTPVKHPKACDRATDRLARLNTRRVRSEQVIDRLNTRIADAKAHHRDDLAARLEARLAKVQTAHDHIVDLITKIHHRCSV
jgi:hypothetical protein